MTIKSAQSFIDQVTDLNVFNAKENDKITENYYTKCIACSKEFLRIFAQLLAVERWP